MTENMRTGHTLDTIFELDYASPMVFITFASLVLIVFSKLFTMTMRRWGYVISKNEIIVTIILKQPAISICILYLKIVTLQS